MNRSEIDDFFKNQLKNWPLAQNNYKQLEEVERKSFNCGDLNGFVQFNPARAVSTLANIEESTIKKRKCFLCEENRPKEQSGIEVMDGWKLLVNPFPIMPKHFTIVSLRHTPQSIDIDLGKELARKLPGTVVFYNGPQAGASAPDHAHYQAVEKTTLPLIELIERKDIKKIRLPFQVILNDDEATMKLNSLNAFFWMDDKGEINVLSIPRKQHRPSEYYLNYPDRRAVSPGAIDMAGVIVTPIKEDYDLLTSSDIENIYKQVGFAPGH